MKILLLLTVIFISRSKFFITDDVVIFGYIEKNSTQDEYILLQNYKILTLAIKTDRIPSILLFKIDAPLELKKPLCLVGTFSDNDNYFLIIYWKYAKLSDTNLCLNYEHFNKFDLFE
ncbi:hypothetical protein HZS_4573 [Henneguya salminicola]|nr:hypothetical protein HZS_4573 [Henneguya salminicola]